jgi:nucleoside phosphorylase
MSSPQVGALEQLVREPSGEGLARHILEFDPKVPQGRVFTSAAITAALGIPGTIEAERFAEAAAIPALSPIPWPAGQAPVTAPLTPPPGPDDPLPTADVLVVTWTVAEAEALADVLTPGQPKSQWYPYAHNYQEYVPLIRRGAPALHYGRLGLYAVTQIGGLKVVCAKSELHLSQDGPELPVRKLWAQMIGEVAPRLVVTTGTAGGIDADTDLGDVVVTSTVRFDCTKRFEHAPFAQATYTDPAVHLPPAHDPAAMDALFAANSARIPAGNPARIWTGTQVITTDFFAFDDTTDFYGLRAADPAARAVEMGDAVLGLVATTDLADPPPWVIIRNASDPQIDGSLTLAQQAATAARIYEKYGYWTTVNSAIVTWSAITDLL